MGLVSGAIDPILESIGSALLDTGETCLKAGYQVWKSCSSITMLYVKRTPMDQTNAWASVTGNIYTISLAIAASLAVLYFVMGWVKESIDIRNTFTAENMVRFFIRYILTASLLVNSLSLVSGITQCVGAVVQTVSVELDDEEIGSVFKDVKKSLKDDKKTEGGDWIAYGMVGMIGGLIGCMVIIVCGISLVLSVLSRLFKMLLCVPFAPVAFAGFAGGQIFSQSGIAWLKTFIGYALEAVVIALAITVSFGLFKDTSFFAVPKKAPQLVAVVLLICGYCMPMVTATACVKGADTVVRRCLGLN